jgi:Cu(I)/Ag(I) efflux system membrane fusion protein
MSEPDAFRPQKPDADAGLPAQAPPGFWRKLWLVVSVVQARLRFFAILAAIALVVGYWGTISNTYEKWTRFAAGAEAAAPDVEYFCPMHPFIVRDNPREKCPICHMDLARRKKGSGKAEPLPPGAISRVQLTPYREVLAGVQTWEVQYLPLSREITAFGTVEFNQAAEAHVATTQEGRIVTLYVNYDGQPVEKGERLAILDVRYDAELSATLEDLLRARRNGNREDEAMARTRLKKFDVGDAQIEEILHTGKVGTQLTITSPIKGHVIKKYQREGNFVGKGTPLYDVADLATVWIEGQVYEADQALVKVGQEVSATTRGLPNHAPFAGKITFIYPHLDEASRTLTVRFELPNPGHELRPGDYATLTIKEAPQQMDLFSREPSAGEGLSKEAAAERRAMLEQGRVLAVPDSAVIDTGALKIVYRESSPHVYDGVRVDLGPRMAVPGSTVAYYPVLSGLAAGDRVVVNGSFLIDAETRLNPAAGSIYFGGSGSNASPGGVAVRPSTPDDEDTNEKKVKASLAKLGPEDRKLAAAQKFCAVLEGSRLGLMGTPVKIALDGKPVFLCCSSCKDKAEADPTKTLAVAEELKKKSAAPPPGPSAPKPEAEDPKVRDNLAKLSPEERALAEAQGKCPVTGKALGSMGAPVRVMIQGQPVLLCCEGCRETALKDQQGTLGKVKQLKAKPEIQKHDERKAP